MFQPTPQAEPTASRETDMANASGGLDSNPEPAFFRVPETFSPEPADPRSRVSAAAGSEEVEFTQTYMPMPHHPNSNPASVATK